MARAIVDSHLHMWDGARFDYPWLEDAPAIAGAHGPDELARDLGGIELEAAVFVHCDCRPEQEDAEAEWASELAERSPVRAVVAGARVERGAAVREQLARHAANPRVKGVRRLIQSETDALFCLRRDFVEGVRAAGEHGFTFDLCVRHHQLRSVLELVRLAPGVTFVLDHLGKPDVRQRRDEPWRTELALLAREPNVVCKLSGLVTEASPQWTRADLAPYVEHALECFGCERLLFGSDWPVVNLAGGYARWVETLDALLAHLTEDELDRIWRSNAHRIYSLGSSRSRAARVG